MRKNIFFITFCLLVISSIVFIFLEWFIPGNVASGDSGYFYTSVFQEKSSFYYSWTPERGSGLGGSNIPFLWSALDTAIPIFLFGNLFHFSWSLILKVAYGYPFLILSLFSASYLFSKVFTNRKFSLLAALVYTVNTYILMIVGGGQFLIGLSYALAPLVIYLSSVCIETIHSGHFTRKLFFSLLLGLLLAVQVLFDLRIVYITLVAVFFLLIMYAIYKSQSGTDSLKNKTLLALNYLVYIFVIPGCIVGLLHAFWILPTLMVHQNPIQQLGSAYSTTNAVTYLSFAKFENSLGLLHPNWPENIFGLTHFMRPEFIFLPIIAFSSLFFIGKQKTKEGKREDMFVVYFALLALVGIFLAKGANDPFGGIYLWMFGHIPGFDMFRDSTKWYVLIAIGYSMLIPYTVSKVYEFLQRRLGK